MDQTVPLSDVTNQPKIDTSDAVIRVRYLRSDPKNARKHSEHQIENIAKSIERFGYVNKISIQPDGTIIGGHATLDAMKRLGWHDESEIEVRVVNGLTPSEYTALGIALNKLPEQSAWDDDVLAQVLGELSQAGETFEGMGFDGAELDALFGPELVDEPAEPKAKKPRKAKLSSDEFTMSIRGKRTDQQAIVAALQAALGSFEGVSIELGIMAIEGAKDVD